MNLATVVLMALAVHFGGAELDLARNVSMEWFQSSRLAGAWELQSRSDGVYTFFAGNSTVLVERLSAPDRTYSITYLCGDELDTVSVVSLVDLPQGSAVGRAGPPGTPIYVDQDSVLAAFERRDAEGADRRGECAGADGALLTVQRLTADRHHRPLTTLQQAADSGTSLPYAHHVCLFRKYLQKPTRPPHA
jgi:hypothetical protein